MLPQKIPTPVTVTANLGDIAEKFDPYCYSSRSDLSQEEKASILAYQRDSSKINRYLRGQYFPDEMEKIHLEQQIENIAASIARIESKLPDGVDVIKGIDYTFATLLLDCGEIKDQAFLSTSFNMNTAITYAQYANDHSDEHDEYLNLVAISLNKGIKFLYLKDDAEILLDNDTYWSGGRMIMSNNEDRKIWMARDVVFSTPKTPINEDDAKKTVEFFDKFKSDTIEVKSLIQKEDYRRVVGKQ